MVRKIVDIKRDIRSTKHSVFSILVEVKIFTKDKIDVINNSIDDAIYNIFTRIGEAHGVDILEWNSEKNNIQITLSLSPDTNLTKYLNAAKASSSRIIKKEFCELLHLLKDGKFWERGFSVFSLDAKEQNKSITQKRK
jgi:transposase IS200-family protein